MLSLGLLILRLTLVVGTIAVLAAVTATLVSRTTGTATEHKPQAT